MALNVVLVEPEIPFNTGNIGRTCVAAGASLHLVGRLGFSLSERQIRRSGLDYWPRLDLHLHPTWDAFEAGLAKDAPLLFFSGSAGRLLWDAPYAADSWLVFGSESRGLPLELLARFQDRCFRIPMAQGERSLNLSSAAAVAIYEGVRRLGIVKTHIKQG